MHLRVIDLDGSILRQRDLMERYRPSVVSLPEWGPRIRIGCRFGRFRRFEADLAAQFGGGTDSAPSVTLYGSGDFHHVSLALLRRQARPINVLVLDNHPDWMRAIPFLHCGTWLHHASRLPQVRRVFHAGGDVDFDNAFRWLAPWDALEAGRIHVFPSRRLFRRGGWENVVHRPLREAGRSPIGADHLENRLEPYREELSRRPLYVSVDKDVLTAGEAVVNWDSGHLTLEDVKTVLGCFLRAAGGNLAGMDLAGDWSPVRVRGLLRRALHLTEHPSMSVDPAAATRRNQDTNRELLESVQEAWAGARRLAS